MKKHTRYFLAFILLICLLYTGCIQDGNRNKDPKLDPETSDTSAENMDEAFDAPIGNTDKPVDAPFEKKDEPVDAPAVNAEKPEVIPVYLEGRQTVIDIAEAEDGELYGNVTTGASKSGYSGTGYITGLKTAGDAFAVSIEVDRDGFYVLNFISASTGEYKENYVYVDEENLGVISVNSMKFTDSLLEHVYLTAGEHKVTVKSYWGWVLYDRVEVMTSGQINPDKYDISPVLSNENATENTKRLMNYLCDIYDEYFLSGQYCSTGQFGKEFVVIKKTTGMTPAVLGLDFIEYTPSRVRNGSSGKQTEFAIDFWESGGIVTFCWHWNAPSKYLTREWYRGFYTDSTNIDLNRIISGKDQEGYELLMKDIDAVAGELLKLQEAGVPILWRPLHEASGGWFWWGASGPEAYKKLYLLLYEKLTREYEINNLIWVWNGQDADWYPGDEYVDIIGEDIYPGERVYTSQIARYLKALGYTDTAKLTYLTENGCVFDPDLAIRDGAMWGMWCTWGSEFVAKDIGIHTLSQQYTEAEMLKKAYSHEKVLTLDELPDLTTYPTGE